MPSRKIDDLDRALRPLAREFLAACAAQKLDVLIICTYRAQIEQDALFAQGRTKPGRIVTWAPTSEHSRADADGLPAARAFDIAVLRNGKIIWGTGGNGMDNDPSDDDVDDLELWERAGAVGRAIGLEWGGDWPAKQRDYPHFQLKD